MKARRRNSRGSVTSIVRRGSDATASIRFSTGKTCVERPDVAREYRLHRRVDNRLRCRPSAVDQAVQGLVRNRLLLVASPRQHHGRLTPDETRQEVLDQDSLSRPRAAVDVDGGRLPAAHRLERGIQDLEMPLPADERSSLTWQPSRRVGGGATHPARCPTDAVPLVLPAVRQDPGVAARCTAYSGRPGRRPRARAGPQARSAACRPVLRVAGRGTGVGRSRPGRASRRRCTNHWPGIPAGLPPVPAPCRRPCRRRAAPSSRGCRPARARRQGRSRAGRRVHHG